ncbi:hypothetical protein B0H66DRAFT_268743 [Apodospora peruviana]|uniref:Uncharacterized protein n=1 Tax=Apodospora peruviana TaxID=516989 RepID=A0AAE0I6U2_9PEZI|nr:hypothetical protein B0H66DRAFT_268743 [Apodospora peruviana]
MVKLKWSIGGKSRLGMRVRTFSDHVEMLHRLIPLQGPTLSRSMNMSWSDQYIYFTDIRGISCQLHLGLCGAIGGFIMYLMLSLKGWELLDSDTKNQLLHGEFWVLPEEEESAQTDPAIHNTRSVILADTWEAEVSPGRKFKMVMWDKGKGPQQQPVGLDTLHRTWKEVVEPILPDDLRFLG